MKLLRIVACFDVPGSTKIGYPHRAAASDDIPTSRPPQDPLLAPPGFVPTSDFDAVL